MTARKASSAYFSLRMVPCNQTNVFCTHQVSVTSHARGLAFRLCLCQTCARTPLNLATLDVPSALFSACALTPRVAVAERSPTSGASPCMQSSDVKLTKDTEGRLGQRYGCQSIVFQAGPMRRPSIGRYRCECVPSPKRKVRTTPWHCRPRGIGALDASTHRLERMRAVYLWLLLSRCLRRIPSSTP